jgi:transcriptional regulator with XRE-family HTH domain
MKAYTSHAIALRLKAIREQIGCTQVQMATRLGITPGAYRILSPGEDDD